MPKWLARVRLTCRSGLFAFALNAEVACSRRLKCRSPRHSGLKCRPRRPLTPNVCALKRGPEGAAGGCHAERPHPRRAVLSGCRPPACMSPTREGLGGLGGPGRAREGPGRPGRAREAKSPGGPARGPGGSGRAREGSGGPGRTREAALPPGGGGGDPGGPGRASEGQRGPGSARESLGGRERGCSP